MVYLDGKLLLRPCDLCQSLVTKLSIEVLTQFNYGRAKPALELCDICEPIYKARIAQAQSLMQYHEQDNIGG